MLQLIRLSVVFGLFLCVFQVCADDSFQIELVVFSQDMPSTELFDQTQTRIEWPDAVLDFDVLGSVAENAKMLKPVYDKLAAQLSYNVLVHAAWQQTLSANATGEAVRIRDVRGEVNGFMRIQRGEYLELMLDLEYQPLSNQFYRLNEVRRIKFNEQHYFDHPKFGVVAIVKPL
ncbi:peptidoglycan binding protein CsiV [Methylicorpusculum oleiharenae]|uniref:CsiV family protein n=1 Tax=Methylicorpusculum oleiharenae TaxID=1338687 RepID=UPI00135756DC|nr:CsiV family protein [Methylicorpusculum oleiharenae]MCD2450919.1 peptidoglycan binding protein CsiV [Methylicorpusculum oleiharenae]